MMGKVLISKIHGVPTGKLGQSHREENDSLWVACAKFCNFIVRFLSSIEIWDSAEGN